MFNLVMMNNDWDSETTYEIHGFDDLDNDKIFYRGTYRDMPTKFENAKIRAFGTIGMHIYIELEPGEEKNL